MIKKSCNLSEQQVDFPRQQESGISSASSDGHLQKQYLSKKT